MLAKVPGYQVKGVPDIKRVLVTEESGEWVIRTDGSNLSKVLEVIGVDTSRTTTNNIHEIAKTLGVEASRNALVHEAKGVLEDQGLDVDVRHVMLVADMMTTTGDVQQIGRHGISGKKASVLARAAFEITVPNIVEAAVKGESDPLAGVTENVIVGQSIPIGTGLVELYMSTFETSRKRWRKNRSMIDIDKALASAVKTGKVSFGTNVALQNAKTGKAKMIVLAANCPKDIKEQIEYYGEISKVPVITYKGGSMDLAEVCKKLFIISALSIRETGDSDILKVTEETQITRIKNGGKKITTGIKITCDEMRYIALFESISGASVKDCIVDEVEQRAIFIVNQGQVGVAIGKGGRNIHTLERMTGKKHEIIEYSEDPATFMKNALKPAAVTRNPRHRTN